MLKIKFKVLKALVLGFLILINGAINAAPLDKIVAIVNTGVITQSELEKRIVLVKRQLGDNPAALHNISKLRQGALDDLIDISLQLQLAKRSDIQISDSELDMALNNVAKANNTTLEKLKEMVPQEEGVSFAEFRKKFRDQGLISKVQQRYLASDITIDEKEIKAVLRNPPKIGMLPQYHILDILLATPESVSQEEMANIKSVAKKMVVKLQQTDNDNIDRVVEENQKTLETSTIETEDLGWRKIDELPELFTKDIARMKVNQVIGPIQAPNGLHLLKLLAIQGGAPTKLTNEQASEIVFHRKLNEKLGPWLKDLRKNAYIKIIK